MVTKMNKKGFIKELSNQTGYDEEKCILINDIIEKHFIFSKNNKEKIIEELKTIVKLDENNSENVYDIAIKIINKEIKNKLKHPFKHQD